MILIESLKEIVLELQKSSVETSGEIKIEENETEKNVGAEEIPKEALEELNAPLPSRRFLRFVKN